jgi:hypothetical protein
MTPEEKRIAVAEACDLFKLAPLQRTNSAGRVYKSGAYLWYCRSIYKGGGSDFAPLPNYLEDLNAMHDAEETLTKAEWPVYREKLRALALSGNRLVWQICKAELHHNAAQRAEAFLQTKGLI